NQSSKEIRYINNIYTITEWNNADDAANLVEGNVALNTNPILEENTFEVVEDLSNMGINISSYVPVGFKDRNGNLVNRNAPSIGAISSTPIFLNSKIFLEGAFENNGMNTVLRDNGLIPTYQPYKNNPWNYSGTESVNSIPTGVVDWVLIEIRSDTSSASIVSRRAAFIKADGSIVDVDGNRKVAMNVNAGNYYIVIQHRNHLPVMSANKIALSSSSPLYDFTTSPGQYFGKGAADLGNGKFGMLAGDGNSNGSINFLDYEIVGNNLFQNGYRSEDLDMNGVVNVIDYGKISMNLLKASKVP
ncbi:MAG TPA: hypothetical protein VMT35_13020, partial [Ignavibacteriaceae bacterium]|nr:hypothetical protein [Ignavibacteriaceae bacterium]